MKKVVFQTFSQILMKDFNLCFFISLIILSFFPKLDFWFNTDNLRQWLAWLVIPVSNGLLTSVIALILNNYFSKKNYTIPYYTKDRTKLFLIAFSAGFCSIYITNSSFGTYLISTFVIFLTILNIRRFAGKISQLLRPDIMASPRDIGEFANFFINLLITFTVINLSINTLHNNLNLGRAFNFGSGFREIIDALYFSVITVTTVGYGDIIPQTVLARIIVSLECLTSYLMLGIMIGIITRGIKFDQENNQK